MGRKHPCLWQQSLSDTIANSVAFHVEKFMHLSTIHIVRSASQTFRSSFSNRTKVVDLGKLYWCSSTDNGWNTPPRWQSYDLTSKTWVTSTCPCDLQRPNHVVGGCGSVYLCGESCCWHRYDAAFKEWHQLPPMPSRRSDCSGALLEVVCGKLYAGGGCDRSGRIYAMERYDPRENVWEELPRFLCRIEFDWSVVSGKLYVCGGMGENARSVNFLECYDGQANVWERLPGLTTCKGPCSVIGLEGCLYVVGGAGWAEIDIDNKSSYTDITLDAFECYHPREQRWTALPPMNYAWRFSSVAASRGCVYVSSWGSCLERFDPALGSWERLVCRRCPKLIRGSSILGTIDDVVEEPCQYDHVPTRIVQFNPATGRWEKVGVRNGLGTFAY
eukprot:TRINITY_DN68063_c0_g1_i1.p1 TRINITY_DN68063_c0_g1~~TRINITY_DN68063_c0_g1_i1.p1  ORF type:complete len:387 (-),score=32.06 TRINITY_DN68063_c0_g1_i1:60-1220(-)